MPDFQQLDVTVANRFISSLSKSLQALCHGCMDFDSGIEIVGYINVSIDCGRKVDYVLNERVLKSNTNSMTFVSNSFLAKKEQTKQTRDGACSPVPELSVPPASTSYSGRFRSSYPSHPGTSSFSQSYVLRGSQKRGMEREWRTPKRLRGGRLQYSSPQETASSGQASYLTDDNSFKLPQSQTAGIVGEESQINIKQEVVENESEKSEFPTDQSQGDHLEQTDEYKSNTESLSAADIKKDPDSSAMPIDETNVSEDTNNESDADFKGTFLQPSTSDQSDETDKLISTVTKSSSGETSEINKPSSSNRLNDVTDDTYAENIASGSEMHLDYEEGDEGNYPQSVHSDAGEGSSDTGQFEVIEIDDEDEDVQAMFAESQSKFNEGKVHAKRIGVSVQRSSSVLNLSCQFCNKKFIEEKNLQDHIAQIHNNLLPYICSLCGKGYRTLPGLKYHNEVHKGTTFSCCFCNAKLSQKAKLKRHLINLHNHSPCAACNQIFPVGTEYNRHVLNYSNASGTKKIFHAGSKSSLQITPSTYTLLNNSSSSALFSEAPNVYQDKSHCPHCKEELTVANMKRHLSEIHGYTMPYHCALCGKGFLSTSGLYHHKRYHTGKKFPCPLCDVSFTQKSKVKRHLRCIHGCLPCSTCSGIFCVGSEYDKHVLHCPSTSVMQ